ncbi:MAG TPA: radical SAM protein [Candidatus Hydrothermia bacterium]|nr:radical SAM protein [Candidatus Hydrothermae bacterium]MDD3649424.1 radical SAM protein [Candidatus Hydrothermia bacterium]MDD5573034.1 radical SAM protein [Candidatus Hydrothermia bacterium]HOK22858.1 radical SAM protein [Candidatus Hydrothermia bacterium]HOL23567.1 radical SAM protein [Candidatus Hydrothermia bacterium]
MELLERKPQVLLSKVLPPNQKTSLIWTFRRELENIRKNSPSIQWFVPFIHSKEKCAIVFPEVLKNAASNLAVHTLYRILNKSFFTDIFSLDHTEGVRTGLKLQDFDVIFFTIDFEPNYYNVIKILLQSGIEPHVDKRTRPILIAGGAAVSINPYPLLPFFNLLCIGEAEVIMPKILTNLKDLGEGCYINEEWVISQNKKYHAKRVYLKDLTESESFSAFYYPDATFKMNLVELSRSCSTKCRFCLLSYNYLPPRWIPTSKFAQMLEEFPVGMDLGLIGGSILDHPDIKEIIRTTNKCKVINPSSIKISTSFYDTLKLLREKGLESITIAPETGSEELRNRLNKRVSNSDILEFIKMLNELRFKHMKMYFMICLPFESAKDILETNNLLKQSKELFDGKISVTFSIFVPKPHTPFQDIPIASKEEFRQKAKALEIPKGINVDIGHYNGAKRQLLYSRAGEELGYAILEELCNHKKIEASLQMNKYLFQLDYSKTLPFHFIDSGVEESFLEREYLKAQKRLLTPHCNPQMCKACGIC